MSKTFRVISILIISEIYLIIENFPRCASRRVWSIEPSVQYDIQATSGGDISISIGLFSYSALLEVDTKY